MGKVRRFVSKYIVEAVYCICWIALMIIMRIQEVSAKILETELVVVITGLLIMMLLHWVMEGRNGKS